MNKDLECDDRGRQSCLDCFIDFNGGPFNVMQYESRGGKYKLCEKDDLAEFVDYELNKILTFGDPDYLKENYDNKKVAIVCHKAPQLAFDVITNNMTWEEALANDWRIEHKWQPGWKYTIK